MPKKSLRLITLLATAVLTLTGCFGDPETVTVNGSSGSTGGSSTSTTAPASTSGATAVVDGTGDSDDCCSPHAAQGCADTPIATCVCEQEASCCAFAWDTTCVALAEACGGCEPATDSGDTKDPTTDDGGGGGSCCSAAAGNGCDDPNTEDCVCAADAYCCDEQWDDVCVSQAQYLCDADCGLPPAGGDCCAPHGGPECDDAEVTECVCAAEPFCCIFPWADECITVAVLQCGIECEGFVPPPPCCVAQRTPGCGDPGLEECVCGIDPFCCDTNWDAKCTGVAQAECGLNCTPPGEGDCCLPNGTPGCELPDVQACVCAFDDFCCNDTWDEQCAMEAEVDCGGCMGDPTTGGSDDGGESSSDGGGIRPSTTTD